MPGLHLLRTYQRRWLRSDLVAGIVLAAILVPQGMAYAELAGLPAVNGLYTTVACLVGYAIMGPSRILVLGPDSSVGPLILAAITPLVVAGDDPGKAVVLAGMMAMIVGVIELGLGLGHLGFVADLLSKEVQVGYMNGLALTIVVGQLPKLCGFSTDADSFVGQLRSFVDGFSGRNPTAMWLGISLLIVLLVLPRFTDEDPRGAAGRGRSHRGHQRFQPRREDGRSLATGVPQAVAAVDRRPGPLAHADRRSLGVTLVSLTDTIATSSASFAARRGDEVNPNQEMIGIGASNIMAGLFQGFAVSTSGSRTAVAEQSGAKSQVTGLVGAGIVALMLVAFSSLFADLPQTALAAVVIAAAISLADIPATVRFAKVRTSSLLLSLTAFAGVVFLGVLPGILVAIVLSILLVLPPELVAAR